MKKIKKILLIGVILLVVLIIAAGVIIGLSLDKIVKAGIERVAPKITQTTVTVDGVSISVLSGSAGVKGLIIGNPEGYKTANIISIGKAAASVSPGSLLSEKIVIRSIEVRSPEVTFEGNPFGENNLKKIMDNVNAVVASPGQGGTTNTPTAAGTKAAKKFEVDDFLLTGVKVHASITGMEGKEFTLPIPDIHFTDLGKGSDGITTAELTQKVLSKISVEVIAAVADYVTKTFGGDANKLLKGASSTAEKAVGGGVEKVKKGLGGLLGK